MRGAYSTIGAKLVERGYAAIPIMPGTKRPGHKRGGEWIGMHDWNALYSKRLPTQFEIDIWSASEAGVCVVCGPGSRDLIGIDFDTDREEIIEALDAILPATPLVKRGLKGQTRFFRCPNINLDPASAFNLEKTKENPRGVRVIDIIGPGKQTVLPPTIHPETGEPYEWIGGLALEDADADEIPFVDADICQQIADALKPFGYQAEPKRAALKRDYDGDDADKPHRMLNDAAMADLEAWIPRLGLTRLKRTRDGFEAVATWRASNGGRPVSKRSPNLKIHHSGIRDFGDDRAYTPIDLVMASQGCDLDTAVQFLALATGWAPVANLITFGNAKEIPEPEPEQETLPATVKPAVPVESAEPFAHLTNVPGVVGELIDWIVATARRPNRVLALGAAVTVVGTLIGRRVASPTRSATHLYCIALAPTGAGKQHPLSCAMRAMKAAGAGHHIGPSEFVSMPAVINFLMRSPLSLCPQDEFGAFLKRVNSRRASGFEASISKALRSAWGASFEAFVTPEWAGRASQSINAPAISIFGLSTPEEFYESLQGDDVTNGFLNRFLVIASRERAKDVETTQAEPGKLPSQLTTALQTLYNWEGTQLGTARLNDPTLDPAPDVLPWASDTARICYRDLSRWVENEMDRVPAMEPFIARTAEIALRLATIRAAGRWAKGAAIDLSDMEWGRDVALASANMVAGDATKRMIVEMSHGKITTRLLEIVGKNGGRIRRRDLQRAIGNGVKPRDFGDAISSLVDSGQFIAEKSTPAAGGPPTLWYSLAV